MIMPHKKVSDAVRSITGEVTYNHLAKLMSVRVPTEVKSFAFVTERVRRSNCGYTDMYNLS